MQLAITVDSICSQLSGIGRYTLEICKGLKTRSEVNDLRFYRNGRWISRPCALLRDEEILEPSPGIVSRFLGVRRDHKARSSTHLFHGTNFFLPREAAVGVITIHDLSVVRFPEMHPEARVKAFEREFSRSLEAAAHIITPSETIRLEVIEYFGCAAEYVSAIPLAANSNFRPRSDGELRAALRRWKLEVGSYALSVATIEPRKKLEQTLAAWDQLPVALKSECPLVIVGGKGWRNDKIRSQIDRAVEQGWVRDLGYFPESQLPLLYAGARLLLYPSTYEGFGLPVVEAMASGTPCIISGTSCLVEVTKGAAIQVNPDDIETYAVAIDRALTDDSWRNATTEEGLRIAAGYSWDKCLSQTMDVYRAASAGASETLSL